MWVNKTLIKAELKLNKSKLANKGKKSLQNRNARIAEGKFLRLENNHERCKNEISDNCLVKNKYGSKYTKHYKQTSAKRWVAVGG